MESHGDQAHTMKNTLETNATKQKKKHTKKNSFKDLFDMSAERQKSSTNSQNGASPAVIRHDTEFSNSEGDSTYRVISTRDTINDQEDTPTIRMSEEDYRKFVDEVNKSMIVLKKIMMATKNISDWALDLSSVCEVGRSTLDEFEADEKDMVDENVLKFLRNFMTDLEKYIGIRERYLAASHDLIRMNSPRAYRDLKQKFANKRSTSIANLRREDTPTKKVSLFKKMEDSASGASTPKKKESPIIEKRKLTAESGIASPMLQKRTITKQMTNIGNIGTVGVPNVPSVMPSPSLKGLKSDFSKTLLQTNANHMSNFMSVATLRKATGEDMASLRDKIKATVNNAVGMDETGLLSPNLAVLNQKRDKVLKKMTLGTNNPTLSAFGKGKVEQKAGPMEQAQTPKKRPQSQSWFKSLRTEDALGLNQFASKDASPNSKNQEPIFTSGSAQNPKTKKIEDNPDFVETMRGYYSDCGPSRSRRQISRLESNSQDVTFDDFEIIKFIGKGAYGEVWLVKKKATGDYYAMKTVDWANRTTQNRMGDIKAEKDIYQTLEGDFVVKAFWTFHYENLICFITEYMLGGDFNKILDKLVRLDEDQAQFYFAELVLAVESLHNLKVVHRDLKPDNILMDAKGHIRLTDFGLSQKGMKLKNNSTPNRKDSLSPQTDDQLSKRASLLGKLCKNPPGTPSKTKVDFKQRGENSKKSEVVFDFLGKTEYQKIIEKKPILQKKQTKESPSQAEKKPRMVGTPDYMAPEIIAPEKYDLEGYDEKCMDWWSMGVILYQLLVGMPAFCDTSIEAVFDNIKNHRMEWPPIGDDEDCISHTAADLIKQLLNPDPKKRLGAKGAEEVKKHPFFKGVNWMKLREREAPIIPCSLDDGEETPLQAPKKPADKSPIIGFGNNRPKTAKPFDFGAFKMRRLDLLDQANQQTHKDLQRQKSGVLKI